MEWTTNEILAGFTAVIGIANIAVGVYLWHRLRHEAHHTGRTAYGALLSDDNFRILLGVIFSSFAIGTVFLLRLPIRPRLLSENDLPGNWWLGLSLYWEVVAAVVAMVGLTFIMWPAFREWGWLNTALVALLVSVVGFLIGASGVEWLVQYF